MKNVMDNFLKMYKPGEELIKPDEQTLEFGRNHLPEEIVKLWEEYGFGNYGDGLIKVINPLEYIDSLHLWLGKKDLTRVPILITSFGDIFYYRDLGNGLNDISYLSIHTGSIKVCGNSYNSFFESFIVNDNVRKGFLNEELFKQSVDKIGKLNYSEIFFFVPALVLGGPANIDHIKKGNAVTHQQLLFSFRH